MLSNLAAGDAVWRVLRLMVVASLLALFPTRTVQVVDQDGEPVPGAVVEPVSLTFQGPKQTTDAEGRVVVPYYLNVQPVVWLRIRKDGFEDVEADVSADLPKTITLRRL